MNQFKKSVQDLRLPSEFEMRANEKSMSIVENELGNALKHHDFDTLTYLVDKYDFDQPVLDSSLMKTIRNGYDDMVDFLLNHGANANARIGGQTPLTTAIAQESISTIAILLNHGADPANLDAQYAIDNASPEIGEFIIDYMEEEHIKEPDY